MGIPNPYLDPPKAGKPKKSTAPNPTIQKPTEDREISPGEVEVKVASWFVSFSRVFKVNYSKKEEEALRIVVRPWIRRYPWLTKKAKTS